MRVNTPKLFFTMTAALAFSHISVIAAPYVWPTDPRYQARDSAVKVSTRNSVNTNAYLLSNVAYDIVNVSIFDSVNSSFKVGISYVYQQQRQVNGRWVLGETTVDTNVDRTGINLRTNTSRNFTSPTVRFELRPSIKRITATIMNCSRCTRGENWSVTRNYTPTIIVR